MVPRNTCRNFYSCGLPIRTGLAAVVGVFLFFFRCCRRCGKNVSRFALLSPPHARVYGHTYGYGHAWSRVDTSYRVYTPSPPPLPLLTRVLLLLLLLLLGVFFNADSTSRMYVWLCAWPFVWLVCFVLCRTHTATTSFSTSWASAGTRRLTGSSACLSARWSIYGLLLTPLFVVSPLDIYSYIYYIILYPMNRRTSCFWKKPFP